MFSKYFAFISMLACLLGAAPMRAETIQVNSSRALQQALNSVSDGGTIEIADGSYSAPSGGFTIYAPKGFTVRAAAGANVTLDGGGATDIVRLANGTVHSGRPVTFQQVTFANGRSLQNFIGGAMTLGNTEAIFVNCIFRNNATNPSTTGGGLWLDNSVASFDGCIFSDNVSNNYGAAMSTLNSRVFIRESRFSGNRVNLPGHQPNAPGGAMFLNSSFVRIAKCSFDNNQAGYVGGAIYALGGWKDPVSTPTLDLTVSDSTFTNNQATRDPSVSFNAPTAGGAIHVEDQTTSRFYNCRFSGNIARQGGSISNYRAITEIVGCTFTSNKATGIGNSEGIGGTIICLSFDGLDATTNFGTLNRRSASLSITDSIIRGSGGEGRQGSGIFVSGDLNSAYGFSGVTKDTSQPPEANRANVTLNRVAFTDLAATSASGTPGTGGAFMGDFINLTVDNSIFTNCSATDYGGAIHVVQGSAATITNSMFEHNDAGAIGGAFSMFGGSLNMSNSKLADNRVTGSGKGSAMVTAPDKSSGSRPPVDMTGVIKDCVFSNNSGGPTIYDGDSRVSPFNRLQYNNNQIFPGDTTAYIADGFGPQSVAQLNNLVISRSDGTSTRKSETANTVPGTAPALGAILMIPRVVLQTGAPGETLPIPSSLVYASSGGTAVVDGTARRASSGVISTTTDGNHSLKVGTLTVNTPAAPPLVAANIATRLPVGTGQNALIGGFIIQGSQPKRLLIRAIGPSLNAFLSGALADPTLELRNASTLLASNDNWQTTQRGGVLSSDQSFDIRGTGIAPADPAEAAILVTLDPGAYTAVVRGANNTTGIALVEVYDLDPFPGATLANISTRGFIQTGQDVMIGGFILQGGTAPAQIVLRGIGPSLTAVGISDPLADPILELHDSNGATVASNDNWMVSPDAAVIQRLGLQPSYNAEAAIYQNALPRGAYTAVVRGKNNGIGVGVVEAYVFQ